MSDDDSDTATPEELNSEAGPPEDTGPIGEIPGLNQSSVQEAMQRARKLEVETRVSSDKRGGDVTANVLKKDTERKKGGATVKVFKG